LLSENRPFLHTVHSGSSNDVSLAGAATLLTCWVSSDSWRLPTARLQSLSRFDACIKVTAGALQQLVRACQRLVDLLALPTTLTSANRDNIQEAANHERRIAAEEPGAVPLQLRV